MTDIVKKYKKAVVGVAGIVASALLAALLGDGTLSFSEVVNVVIMAIGAISVGIAPDTPGARYVKNALAGLSAAAVLLLSVYSGGISKEEWGQMAVAAATAAGIIKARNKGDNLERETNVKMYEMQRKNVPGPDLQ